LTYLVFYYVCKFHRKEYISLSFFSFLSNDVTVRLFHMCDFLIGALPRKSHGIREWFVTFHLLIIHLVLWFLSRNLSLEIYGTSWLGRCPTWVRLHHWLKVDKQIDLFFALWHFLEVRKAVKEIWIFWLLPKLVLSYEIEYISVWYFEWRYFINPFL